MSKYNAKNKKATASTETIDSNQIIRSSRHCIQANHWRKDILDHFLDSYLAATQNYIDFLWNAPFCWGAKGQLLDVASRKFHCPSVLDYKVITFPTDLSQRALSSAATQALGIVKGAVKKISKAQYALQQATKKKACDAKKLTNLNREVNIELARLSKPILKDGFQAELSSKNCALKASKKAKHFEYWLHLWAIGFHDPIDLPVKLHKQVNKLKAKGFQLMTSFLLSKDAIELRWFKYVEPKKTGIKLGCDSGVKQPLTFSTGDNSHNSFTVNGVSYEESLTRCARKKGGSKARERALHHRDCIIGAIGNRCKAAIVSSGCQTIYLEKNASLKQIVGLSKKQRRHSWMGLKNKLIDVSEELGVQVIQTSSWYKSQRCSQCGWTQKSNRASRDLFKCKSCGFTENADINAARNQVVKLPWLDLGPIKEKKLNLKGFMWKPVEEAETAGSMESPVGLDKSKNLIEDSSIF